ncbi:MAG TPA: hypothetical protein ENJ18_12170, partial [Nannocystis exedens]|nr:hypothetical protein [Nannocystis exedens]
QLPVITRDGYLIGPVFAKGGIGRIVEARDRYLGRRVALKELLVRSRHAEERFVREALVTARLQHPGVVPIYAAGRWPSGEPFYAMKLVSGRPLSEAFADAPTYEARVALLPHVLAVAETMAYAHSKRIMHRDLKPENILLGSYGETVVIDWGLAKELDKEDAASSPLAESALRAELRPKPKTPSSYELPAKDLTMVGAVVGTPAYMPPEQAYGDPVDQRADVYALGAILYHMVAGAPPFDGATAVEILLKVTSDPPPPIETREPAVPPELAAIIASAMAYKPADRYPSAEKLADDLRRFRTGQLVAAHRYSARDRLRRLIRRYRGPLVVAAASLVVLAVISVLSITRIIAERDEAQLARTQAEEARDAAAHAREESEAARLRAERQADALALEQARLAARDQPARTLELLAGLHSKEEWPRLRMIAADAAAHDIGVNLIGHSAGASRIAFSEDGRFLASAADDCVTTLWDLKQNTGRRLLGHTDEVWRVEFNRDSTLMATASRDHSVGLWQPESGERLALLKGHNAAARTVAFTADGEHLLSGGDDNRLLLWNLHDHSYELLEECLSGSMFSDGWRVACVSNDRMKLVMIDLESRFRQRWGVAGPLGPAGDFAPDSDELAVGTATGDVWRWRWKTDKSDRLRGGTRMLRAVRYTEDGTRILGAGADREVWVWQRSTNKRLHTLTGHGARITRLDVSKDSRFATTAGGETAPRLWDLKTGSGSLLKGLGTVATAVRFSPDGRMVAASSGDGELRLWHIENLRSDALNHRRGQALLAVDRRQPRIATVDKSGTLRVWNLDTQEVIYETADAQPIIQVAILPTSNAMLTLSKDAGLTVMTPYGETVHEFPALDEPLAEQELSVHFRNRYGTLLVSDDGRHVIAGRNDGDIVHWDLKSREARLLRGHSEALIAHAFSPDSRFLVSAGFDRSVRLWDLQAGTSTIIDRHSLPVSAIAFSPDGRFVYSGGEAHKLRIYDRQSGEVSSDPIGGFRVYSIVPFADGRRLALLRGDNQILIWDLDERRVSRRLLGHRVPVRMLVLADNDLTLLSQSEDGEFRLWDVGTGENRTLAQMRHRARVAVWHPSRRIIALSPSGELGIWQDPIPRDRDAFFRWLDDSRRSLTLSIDDLTPPANCRALEIDKAAP